MTTDGERLRTNLKHLGLHTIADVVEREAQKAAKTKQSYVGFLSHLVDEELAAKADRSVNARIARARFPAIRTLEASAPRARANRISPSPSASAPVWRTSAFCFAPLPTSSLVLGQGVGTRDWNQIYADVLALEGGRSASLRLSMVSRLFHFTGLGGGCLTRSASPATPASSGWERRER